MDFKEHKKMILEVISCYPHSDELHHSLCSTCMMHN